MAGLHERFGISLACALLFAGSVASAAPPPNDQDGETVVYGQRAAPAISRRVAFADLDLTGKAGEKQLIHRVRTAILRACPSDSTLEKHHCRNEAWLAARPQIKQAVKSARNIDGFVEMVSMVIVLPNAK